MNSKKFIAIFLFAVYSIILAHSFISHEHHSDFSVCGISCSTHTESVGEDCCTAVHNHDLNTHKHLHCHFVVHPVVTKVFGFSDSYLLTNSVEISYLNSSYYKIPHFFLSRKIPDRRCRDVSLRAPPSFYIATVFYS